MPDRYGSIPCMTCRESSCFDCERLKFVVKDESWKWRFLGWEVRGTTPDGLVRLVWPHDYKDLKIP